MSSHKLILPLTLVICFVLFIQVYAQDTMFDLYLKQTSPAMSYSISATTAYSDCTFYTITMRGVNWLTEKEIGSASAWSHYLLIAVPKTLDRSIKEGFLLIEAGKTGMEMPTGNAILQAISTNSQTVSSMLLSVPNQPITFESDSSKTSRAEDQIMSFSWLKFMEKMNNNMALNRTVYNVEDYEWLAHFAMAKTSIRAMDVIQDFVNKQIGFSIEKFTVAGTSKRGWATWLVGASKDSRIKSLIPIVIQIMNLKECFLHINKSICAWPEALQDYKKLGVLDQLNTTAFDLLAQAVDPFNYRDRYTNIPTYMINAMGDEFMWPDLSLFSYQQLPGLSSKHIRYVPNAGHSLAGSDVPQSVLAYYYAITRNSLLPQYTFYNETISNGLRIWVKVTNGIKPTKVILWYGTNTYSRDFRQNHVGSIFNSKVLTEVDSFTWRADVENPKIGYTAFTIEMTFTGYGPSELKYSTSAYILPLDRFICAGANSLTFSLLISFIIFTLLLLQ